MQTRFAANPWSVDPPSSEKCYKRKTPRGFLVSMKSMKSHIDLFLTVLGPVPFPTISDHGGHKTRRRSHLVLCFARRDWFSWIPWNSRNRISPYYTQSDLRNRVPELNQKVTRRAHQTLCFTVSKWRISWFPNPLPGRRPWLNFLKCFNNVLKKY